MARSQVAHMMTESESSRGRNSIRKVGNVILTSSDYSTFSTFAPLASFCSEKLGKQGSALGNWGLILGRKNGAEYCPVRVKFLMIDGHAARSGLAVHRPR